jgi:hypothetical protein
VAKETGYCTRKNLSMEYVTNFGDKLKIRLNIGIRRVSIESMTWRK